VQTTDLDSGMSTQRTDRARTIEVGATSASVGWATSGPVELLRALAALVPVVASLAGRTDGAGAVRPGGIRGPRAADENAALSQEEL
jgi:hypothetical protein